jgi:hypothetical protein
MLFTSDSTQLPTRGGFAQTACQALTLASLSVSLFQDDLVEADASFQWEGLSRALG